MMSFTTATAWHEIRDHGLPPFWLKSIYGNGDLGPVRQRHAHVRNLLVQRNERAAVAYLHRSKFERV